ncbi:hypothetical protein [Pseudoroseicyclus aestuarii]|uniref:Putative secreted protein n=1 Tax=Pseudoroseicyclus aestuarii TaxID=1795041 RepID=A0A318SZT1_9RHOB|nr:hypothetical protein [Pseudoroseicyclus aestuarii]PYE85879.1 putative secreted protein [Pseudoroseicyclus aestuarii]
MKTYIAAALFATAIPVAAAAAPISAGDYLTDGFSLGGDSSTASYSFEPTGQVKISNFAISGTGGSEGADLVKVSFGVDSTDEGFEEIYQLGGISAATAFLDGMVTSSPFTLQFDATGVNKPVSLTYSFDVEAAAVPVPAAGGLLVLALAGAGFVSRRKSKA